MSTPANPVPTNTTFFSIERVVAFVLGPAVTAGAGYVALLVSELPGAPHVSGETVYAFASAVALSTGGLVYKWLHGRQLEASAKADLAHLEHTLGVSAAFTEPLEGFIKTTAADLEGLAQSAATRAVEAVTGGKGATSATAAQTAAKPPGAVTGDAGGD